MYHWTTITAEDGNYYVALIDDTGATVKVHPIEFEDHREANRAAERLNKRDF